MGTEIQEPGQLPDSALTDATAENFALLAYEKRDDGAGLKKLNLVPWKNYLNFNGYAVKNVGALCGFNKTQYDVDHEITVQQTDTLVYKINALQSNTGVSATPGATPLTTQIADIKTQVGNPSDSTVDPPVAATGMCLDIETNADNISNLSSIVGTPAAGSGTLVSRVTQNETDIADLQTRTTSLETEIGTAQSGGLKNQVADLNTTVYGDGSDPSSGLYNKVSNLESVTSEHTSQITSLQTSVGLITPIVSSNTERIVALEDKTSTVYRIMGNVDQAKADTWLTPALGQQTPYYATMDTGMTWNVDNSPTGDYVTFLIPLTATDPETGTHLTESLKVDNGGNVVWIKKSNDTDPNNKYLYGYLDELSSTIADSRIPVIEGQVNTLQTQVGHDSYGTEPATGLCLRIQNLETSNSVITQLAGNITWTSNGLTGTYMILAIDNGASAKLGGFIVSLNNGQVIQPDVMIMELGSKPYTDYITRDGTTGLLFAKDTLQKLIVRRIGD